MRKSVIAAFAFVGLTLAPLSPSLALEKITLAQGIPSSHLHSRSPAPFPRSSASLRKKV